MFLFRNFVITYILLNLLFICLLYYVEGIKKISYYSVVKFTLKII